MRESLPITRPDEPGEARRERTGLIWIVEDDPQLRLCARRRRGIWPSRPSRREADRRDDAQPQLIPDIGLPDGDGIDETRRGARSRVPIIDLGAAGITAQDARRVPTTPDEAPGVNELLRARIRGAASRGGGRRRTPVSIGPLRLDFARREVKVAGSEVHRPR
jgi:DNA-binding response OmpR family regulator